MANKPIQSLQLTHDGPVYDLAPLWDNIQEKPEIKNTANIAYGICETAANNAEKIVTIINDDNWVLTIGSVITVKFTATNSVASPKLNVNGTGAKPIYYNNAEYTSASSYGGYANRHITYQYDGTHWVFISWSYDSNSDTKVQQNAAITTAGEYPVLLAYSTATSKETNAVQKTSTMKYNPSTKILTVPTVKGNLTGNADTATSASNLNITRITSDIKTIAGSLPIRTEVVYFGGSDAISYSCPTTYCIINIKKGENHRTLLDCYDLNTGDHYINGCMNADGTDDVWTGWIKQPNPTEITNLQTQLNSKASITYVDQQDAQTLSSAKEYTDNSVANLLNNSSEAVDSIFELRDAMENNADAIDALTEIAGSKVDKVDGKGLSTNDYTTEEKNKLAGIAVGAEVNVQSDWNQNDETADDYIKNRTHWIDEEWTLVSDEYRSMMIFIPIETDVTNGLTELGHYRFTVNNTDVYLYEKTTEDKTSRYCIGGASGDNLPFKIERYDSAPEGYILRRLNRTVSSFKVEYLVQSIKYLDDKYISSSIARTAQLIGLASSEGGEIFNDYENNSANSYSHAEGQNTTASGNYSHSEGQNTVASGDSSHAEGQNTEASGDNSHAEGSNTYAVGSCSHTEGGGNDAIGDYSHAEGVNNRSTGGASHTEGSNNKATATGSHAEGGNTEASGEGSHAEGYGTKALEFASHAEGRETTASSEATHAEGFGTTASEAAAHAEGAGSIASGYASHAEGQANEASGYTSHAEGQHTKASGGYQHVQGRYNVEDAESIYAHIVGNGDYDGRSNAHTLDWQGNAWFEGDVYVGSTSGTNKDEGSKKLATEDFITTEINKIPQSDWNQNEESAPDYIKNKPFGKYEDEIIDHEETFTGFNYIESDNYYRFIADSPHTDIISDQPNDFIVYFDGIRYEVTKGTEYSTVNCSVGNYSIVDNTQEDTGEPFFIAVDIDLDAGGYLFNTFYTILEGDSHTIKIAHMSETVVKIPEKYLPEISSLPPVTSDDKGKVLAVEDDGNWGAGTVTLKITDDGNGNLSVVLGVVKTIMFAINTMGSSTAEYTAEQNMTWAEWCDSKYNTIGAFIKNNLVMLLDDFYVKEYIKDVLPTDIIEDRHTYDHFVSVMS